MVLFFYFVPMMYSCKVMEDKMKEEYLLKFEAERLKLKEERQAKLNRRAQLFFNTTRKLECKRKKCFANMQRF